VASPPPPPPPPLPQGQIQELREENDSLVEKLQAEEERRKQLAGKSQVLLQDSPAASG